MITARYQYTELDPRAYFEECTSGLIDAPTTELLFTMITTVHPRSDREFRDRAEAQLRKAAYEFTKAQLEQTRSSFETLYNVTRLLEGITYVMSMCEFNPAYQYDARDLYMAHLERMHELMGKEPSTMHGRVVMAALCDFMLCCKERTYLSDADDDGQNLNDTVAGAA